MINKCLCLRYRKKQGKIYCYCTKKRAVIELFECKGCVNKEYKEVSKKAIKMQNKTYSKLKQKTPIKKVSKKRIMVSEKTYKEVYERCNGMCAICGTNQNLHLHHVDGRGKDKTDDPKNCIMLCCYCHLEVVHKNNKYWRKKLKEMV